MPCLLRPPVLPDAESSADYTPTSDIYDQEQKNFQDTPVMDCTSPLPAADIATNVVKTDMHPIESYPWKPKLSYLVPLEISAVAPPKLIPRIDKQFKDHKSQHKMLQSVLLQGCEDKTDTIVTKSEFPYAKPNIDSNDNEVVTPPPLPPRAPSMTPQCSPKLASTNSPVHRDDDEYTELEVIEYVNPNCSHSAPPSQFISILDSKNNCTSEPVSQTAPELRQQFLFKDECDVPYVSPSPSPTSDEERVDNTTGNITVYAHTYTIN